MGTTNRTVLLIDDDGDIRESITTLLEDDGYDVVVATNGKEGLERMRSGPRPCVILLDLMMPVMDGWDFRAAQREDPYFQDIPVVIITAAGFSRETVLGQLGDVAFVPKPPPVDGLREVVRSVCGRTPTSR